MSSLAPASSSPRALNDCPFTHDDLRAAAALLDRLNGDVEAAIELLNTADELRHLLGVQPTLTEAITGTTG